MNTLKPDEKKALITEWRGTGKTAAEYCRIKGIKPTTFYGWIKNEKKNKLQKFVEISKTLEPVKKDEIILEKGDVKIHIPVSLIESELKQILKAFNI
jgi:transposase-like protein